MNKKKVLFVCIHNSARSQMAEAFLNQMAGESFIAESAGMEPGRMNPIVVEAMQEIGIDISKNMTNSVAAYLNKGRRYDYVITVCDKAKETCPHIPAAKLNTHHPFTDPAYYIGDEEEVSGKYRDVRDRIGIFVKAFIEEQALQCGYCTNGMIINAAALLVRNPAPEKEDIRQALAGNLCRCGAHPRIIRAVRRAAEILGKAAS